MYSSMKDVMDSVKSVCEISNKGIKVINKQKFQKEIIDLLVYNSVFNEDHNIHDVCSWIIWESAQGYRHYPKFDSGFV